LRCASFTPQYMSVMTEDGRWTLPEEEEEEDKFGVTDII
jgi:hypothetical protein